MRAPIQRLAATLSAALLVAGCAGAGANAPSTGERSEVRDVAGRLVVANDVEKASRAAEKARSRRSASPWTHVGAALLARRSLDAEGEVASLVAAVGAGPGDPVALVALRRLAELAETSPDRAREVEAGLAPLAPRLAGLAAYRARVARIMSAEVLGEHPRAAALRAENGAISAWSLAGPFGLYAALDLETPYPPEQGIWPTSVAAPLGLPERATRRLPAPDGSVSLEGEPVDGDVYYLAADVDVARGGRYLASLGTQMSARLWIDGRALLERRAAIAHLPTLEHVPVELAPGRHRLLVKVARGRHRSGLHVALAREDGAPSDVRSAEAVSGPSTPVAGAAPPPLFMTGRELESRLEPDAGTVLARYLAARDVTGSDRDTAKAMLAEALALAPASAALHAARADALENDSTLDDSVSRARQEADLREALARDPGHAEARTELARLLVQTSRLDDGDAALAALDAQAASRPLALEVRARAAEERGLSERADALASQAGAGATCGSLEIALSLAERRRAVSREDELVRLRASCRGGRERLAGHLRRRGDPRGAAEALAPLVEARPWDPEPVLARASALFAAGDAKGAVAAVEALAAIWPRNARFWARVGEQRELAGDLPGARQARERALALDGGDLGLRRALALEDGPEVLADLAEDGDAALAAYAAAKRPTDTSSTMVLDAAAVEIHPGGTATERTHQIIQVLDQRGVEQYGEIAVPAGADVLILRTRKPDGRRLEPERAGATKGTVSLAGLEPGDFVEVEWLRSERGIPGGFAADPFYFQVAGTRIQRSTYAVAAPAALGLEVDAHGMPAPVAERKGDRLVLRAERTAIPALVPEPGASPPTEYLPFLHVGVGAGRDALQRQMSEAVADRTRPTEELRALAAQIRTAAGPTATPADLVRTAYARVAKQVLGTGGGLADDASEVLSRGRGSRLVVLKAVLDGLGMRSRFALVRPFTADPAPYRFPGHGLYSQLILRVEAGGETFWLDPSMRQAPFGLLQPSALDSEALVLAAPGEPLEVVRTPARGLVEDGRDVAVRIALAPDASAEISGTDTYRGALAAGAKAAVERLDPASRRQAVEAMLARSFRGLAVSEAAFEGEEDPQAPLVIRWKGTARDVMRATAAGAVLDGSPFAARLGARFVQVAARTTPLLVGQPERSTLRVEVVPPPGLIARPEPGDTLATPFGTYTRSDHVEGLALVREERLVLERGRIAPGRYTDFASFAASVDAVQERPLALTRSTRGDAPPPVPRS